MRILHMPLNYLPSTGGLQTLFREVSERLVSQHADDVEVWTVNALTNPARSSAPPAGAERETVAGVRIRRFPYARKAQRLVQMSCAFATQAGVLPARALPALRLGPVAPRMSLALLSARPDVVCVAPAGYLHVVAPLLARAITRVPVVLVGALHLPPDERLPRSVTRAIDRADAYIALTPYEAEVVLRLGVAEAKVFVAGPGIDPVPLEISREEARRALELPPGPLVAFIGRHAPYKGIVPLIDAMERVWDREPEARVVIAGPETAHTRVIRARLDQLAGTRRERVVLWGEVDSDRKHKLFAAADVLVNVSSQESFGIVVLEAWLAGTPIVAADIAATRNVIASGSDGVLVPPNDADQLAGVLDRLLTDAPYRERLAKNGRRSVERHTWDRTVDVWRDAYLFAASRRGSASS